MYGGNGITWGKKENTDHR